MAAEAPRVYKAMLNCPFIVVADMWMTPTATACADLVLPVAMSCERDSFREWWTPSRAITKITQYEEAKSDEEILVDLSLRLNGDNVPWHDVESLLNWVLAKDNAPRTWTELKDMMYEYNFQGYRRYESGKLRPDGQPGFNTMTASSNFKAAFWVRSATTTCRISRSRPRAPFRRPNSTRSTRSCSPPASATGNSSTLSIAICPRCANSAPSRPSTSTRLTPRSTVSKMGNGCGLRISAAAAARSPTWCRR